MSTENLSPEEQEVNRLINESKARIADMEKQMNDLHRDQGPAPRYNMPGGPQPHEPGRNAEQKQEFLKAIHQEKNDLTAKVDKTLSDAPPGVKEKGQKNLTSFLYPQGKAQEKTAEKSLNPSQEFAMKLRYSKGKEQDIPAHERAQEKGLDASQDFAQKLRFQANDKQSKTAEEKDDVQKEDPVKEEKDAPMSMSTQFSQKLGFTQWEERGEGDDAPPPEKAKDDIEPDKD